MKKLFSIVVIMVLCVALFVGCAPKAAETPSESAPEATEAPAETSAAQETEEAPAGDGPLLAFICKDLSQEWFVGTSTAMQETAKSVITSYSIHYTKLYEGAQTHIWEYLEGRNIAKNEIVYMQILC